MTAEQNLAQAILGQSKASILMTDGYKFAMAQAGFPLREETFVLTLRKNGPFYIPLRFAEVIQNLIPDLPTVKEGAFLTANGYGMTPAMEQAITGKIRIWAAPKGSWVMTGEPVLTITGPSFLVSWLEPLVIMLQYSIQIATALVLGVRKFPAVCEDEVQILRILENALGIKDMQISLDKSGYKTRVRENVKAVVDALGGDAHRAFEVGLRAATCMQQHLMALEECRALGLLKTANVFGAWKLYMIPVGTTGHEHQERWGNDEDGFRAVRDMRPETPSYLFDTHDPIKIGLPAAFRVIEEQPDRPCSLRFDSGDQDTQFKAIRGCCSQNTAKALFDAGLTTKLPPLRLRPNLIFEDGYTAEKTGVNEAFCEHWEWPRDLRMYGYGGFLISAPHPSPYHRDLVSAAYKLSWSNGPKRKFGKGKGSTPGRPIIYRKIRDRGDILPLSESFIAQEGEELLGYLPLTEDTLDEVVSNPDSSDYSLATQRLIDELTEKRDLQCKV